MLAAPIRGQSGGYFRGSNPASAEPPGQRSRHASLPPDRPLFLRRGPDPTSRLTPTPLVADLGAAGCAIRLETNSPAILRLVRNSLNRSPRSQPTQQTFLWRLVSDRDAGWYPPRPGFSSVSSDGIQLVNMGQRSFMAMDAAARCAVGFLAEEFLKEGGLFEKAVLTRLIALTAAALRWKPDLSPKGNKDGFGLTKATK